MNQWNVAVNTKHQCVDFVFKTTDPVCGQRAGWRDKLKQVGFRWPSNQRWVTRSDFHVIRIIWCCYRYSRSRLQLALMGYLCFCYMLTFFVWFCGIIDRIPEQLSAGHGPHLWKIKRWNADCAQLPFYKAHTLIWSSCMYVSVHSSSHRSPQLLVTFASCH